MATLLPDMSLQQFQLFTKEVYEHSNNRNYEAGEMLSNIQRFAMRGIKGIRKEDTEKIKKNLIISLSWFMSLLNRLHIEIGEELWQRFPYRCSYCNSCPCTCKTKRPEYRQKVFVDNTKKPKTLSGFQKMFNAVYPASSRTLDHAGIHLAEEVGEFSEAVWAYRSKRSPQDFQDLMLEAADYISCILGIFNSINLDLGSELAKFFPNNCHECMQSPCTCTYEAVKQYKL